MDSARVLFQLLFLSSFYWCMHMRLRRCSKKRDMLRHFMVILTCLFYVFWYRKYLVNGFWKLWYINHHRYCYQRLFVFFWCHLFTILFSVLTVPNNIVGNTYHHFLFCLTRGLECYCWKIIIRKSRVFFYSLGWFCFVFLFFFVDVCGDCII